MDLTTRTDERTAKVTGWTAEALCRRWRSGAGRRDRRIGRGWDGAAGCTSCGDFTAFDGVSSEGERFTDSCATCGESRDFVVVYAPCPCMATRPA